MRSKKDNALFLLVIFLFPFASCTRRVIPTEKVPVKPEEFRLPHVPYTWVKKEISVRVGLGEFDELVLMLEDTFYIYEGNTLKYQGTKSPLIVSIYKTKPAQFYYYVSYGDFETMSQALAKARDVSNGGAKVKVKEIGKVFKTNSGQLSTISYLVYQGPFESQSEAIKNSNSLRKTIFKEIKSPPHGVFKLKFSDKSYESTDIIRIVSKAPMKIINFRKKDHYTGGTAQRPFLVTGILEIRPSNEGKILAINELSLETYVEGVLKGEVPLSFPQEALKAQSVAARTNALSSLGKKLSIYHEPYDVTADIFTQNFEGFNDNAYLKSIVDATRGEVLTYNGKAIQVFYFSSCGGSLASSHEIFGKELDYYRARKDDFRRPENLYLYDDSQVRRFIDSNPISSSCEHGGNKYYRWERVISSYELSQNIKNKLGKDLGEIIDVKVTKRGPSGRAQVIFIEGGKSSTFVEGDLEIRKALDKNLLPSSLFYIENFGSQFVIRGAGFGHGVGMCQYGAAGLASKGKTYREILQFYYPGTKIEKIY
ncbi:MAG: SpoIID/LytB domain-containing protein [candidate division WOR-3 bacterium]